MKQFGKAFSDWYSKARGSYGYLLVFNILMGLALTAHYFMRWDTHWETTNLILSYTTEVGNILIMIHNARAEKRQEHILEATHAMVEAILEGRDDDAGVSGS